MQRLYAVFFLNEDFICRTFYYFFLLKNIDIVLFKMLKKPFTKLCLFAINKLNETLFLRFFLPLISLIPFQWN